MTNCDMGEEGPKNAILRVTYILSSHLHTVMSLLERGSIWERIKI